MRGECRLACFASWGHSFLGLGWRPIRQFRREDPASAQLLQSLNNVARPRCRDLPRDRGA
eukprot:3312699-Alexandrium_andersonii.AAC.1